MSDTPLYLDATILYRWRSLAPVGIVRLERLLAAHVRFRSGLGQARYVLWDSGYRLADDSETELLDRVLSEITAEQTQGSTTDATGGLQVGTTVGTPTDAGSRRGLKAGLRRQGMRVVARFPEHIRPIAEQTAWSMATLAVESARHVRRSRAERTKVGVRTQGADVRHRVDFSSGGDLIALGLGWEYIDHEAMYRLKHEHGVRIHMPAFDLIPVTMPQLNVWQSDLVHRYYAEMAHYADTVTGISYSTTAAVQAFFEQEQLPLPVMATNQVPTVALRDAAAPSSGRRRHRLEGQPYVLSVSTVEIRKNHLLLAKVWTECAREGVDLPRLAIVGRIGWDVDELMRWVEHAPELRSLVKIYADVDDAELHEMYSDALFTVFPSRIEGWGMPISESMAYGKVCLHADDPAQHEASQGLMPFLHPDDFVGWKREIIRLAQNDGYRRQQEQLIEERFVPRTVDDYCATFEAIVAARRAGGA
jgi:glycosyltransferase involved in cell wall biosynthesis